MTYLFNNRLYLTKPWRSSLDPMHKMSKAWAMAKRSRSLWLYIVGSFCPNIWRPSDILLSCKGTIRYSHVSLLTCHLRVKFPSFFQNVVHVQGVQLSVCLELKVRRDPVKFFGLLCQSLVSPVVKCPRITSFRRNKLINHRPTSSLNKCFGIVQQIQ